MALVLDYEFDNFSTAADGTRKVVDASGNLNDGTMESGQGLAFDGSNDYIDTGFAVKSTWKTLGGVFNFQHNTLAVFVYGGDNAINNRFGLGCAYMGYANIYKISNTSIGTFSAVLTKRSTGNVHFWQGTNEVYFTAANDLIDEVYNSTPVPFCIGAHVNNGVLKYTGSSIVLHCFILDVEMTDADIIYFNNNSEAIIEMAITQTSNPNLSFQPSNILHLWPLDEGNGNTVTDIITGQVGTMINMPTDNTQWTNADLQPYGHQKFRFKKDVNGNPSALADPKTVRFD